MSVPEALKHPNPDNPASWRWIVAFYEEVTAMQPDYGDRYLSLLRLVRRLAASPHSQTFRAGQSVHSLVISTKERNGLEANDPHTRVVPVWFTPMLRVEYWRGRETSDLVESQLVDESGVYEMLERFLERLQIETSAPRE